jgi:multiple sugar transport system substrate-binding protein
MSEIEFLTVANDQGSVQQIEDLLARFQQTSHISLHNNFVSWDAIWRELVNVGIYRRGADIAELGTTWLESLMAMNVLRPFTANEINRLGGKSAFIPATWMSTSVSGDARVWGIPIRCDVRVIWYWKDMLEDAKIEPVTAFTSPSNIRQTLEKLTSVLPTPWGTITAVSDPNIIQALATWIWAWESDFVSSDGKKILLMNPASLEAMRAYFGLYQFMPLGDPDLSGVKVVNLFMQRKLAAIFAGPWNLQSFASYGFQEEDMARIGISVTPGPPFVGGTVLAIWEHARQVENIVKFIEYLVQPEVQIEYCPLLGLLPTRKEAWETPQMTNDPHYQVIYQALSMGRSLPAVPLWGMIEEKLKVSFSLIWKDLLQGSQKDVDKAIHAHLEPIVNRLNISIQ